MGILRERCDGTHPECPGETLPSHGAAWHFSHWLLVTGWLPQVEFWESESGAVLASNLKMFVTKCCFGLHRAWCCRGMGTIFKSTASLPLLSLPLPSFPGTRNQIRCCLLWRHMIPSIMKGGQRREGQFTKHVHQHQVFDSGLFYLAVLQLESGADLSTAALPLRTTLAAQRGALPFGFISYF